MWATVEAAEDARDVAMSTAFTDLPGLSEIVEWVTSRVSAGLRQVKPDSVTAEVGVELAVGERGIVAALAGAGGKATVKVTVTWGGVDARPTPEQPTDTT